MKRFFDIVIASFVLLLLMTLLLTTAALIRINMGAPILFRQVRPGYLGIPFTLLKLRLMSHISRPDGELLPPEQRFARFNKIQTIESMTRMGYPQSTIYVKSE